MRILITNDDGIHAPGLEACETIARTLSDEVWIVAPETDQSGVSHSLSLNDPLRLREVAEKHFAVQGTPTDCVIMGVRHIMKESPDLVLSGVNRGRNCAEDVTYSGTVAGAMEGTVLGIPSFALSQAYASANRHKPYWDTAIKFAPDIIERVLKAGMPRDVLVNVNFPDCPPDEVAGTVLAVQGKRDQELLHIDAAPRRARQSVLLDRVRARRHRRRRAGQRSCRAQRQAHRDHAAAARPDRREVHDQACGCFQLAHDPEKWEPVFGQDHAQKELRPGKQPVEHGFELLDLEWFLQCRAVAIGIDQAVLAIAGDEHEGQAALGQNFGDRINLLAVEIDVEHGGVEIAFGREVARLGDGTDRRGDLIAEVGEHIFQQHADQIFVFDDEDTRCCRGGIAHRRLKSHKSINARAPRILCL